MILLSVDPGYATVGWCVLNDTAGILTVGSKNVAANEGSVFARSLNIVKNLYAVAQHYKVTHVTYELFFSVPIKGKEGAIRYRAAANHGRGIFDGLFEMTFRYCHLLRIHPMVLKSWLSRKTKMQKPDIADRIRVIMEQYNPGWYAYLRQHYHSSIEHALDAYALGLIAWQSQQTRQALLQLNIPNERVVIAKDPTKLVWENPVLLERTYGATPLFV